VGRFGGIASSCQDHPAKCPPAKPLCCGKMKKCTSPNTSMNSDETKEHFESTKYAMQCRPWHAEKLYVDIFLKRANGRRLWFGSISLHSTAKI
jgi:hypothetical protein